MNKTYLQKLEYNKIIEQLEKNCVTYIGKDLAKSLVPSFEKSEVEATIESSVISIKNPKRGTIHVLDVQEIIMDDVNAKGKVLNHKCM